LGAAVLGSLRALIDRVENEIDQGKLNLALNLIDNFVERIITEPLCTAQVFGSHELDRLCLLIGKKNISGSTFNQVDPWPFKTKKPRIIYIISRLQKSGGHSRLLYDFIRAQPNKDHLILSTGAGGPSDRNCFANIYRHVDNVQFISAPKLSLQSRLMWLQNMLSAIRPEHVYLLNHHHDSVAVAAPVPELELKCTFLHHGDHHLCLGVCMEHFAHIDFHPMGFHYCRNVLSVNNKYLPLTFEDKHFSPIKSTFTTGGYLTTATVGRSNKVEIPYYISYLDIVPKILLATGGQHIHVGKLTPWALRHVRSQMRKNKVPEDRFIYIEWTPSVWEFFRDYSVDVFIAPFPYGAGLTLIEALGAGVPVILHQHIYSRLLGGLDLAYPEAFCWNDPEALLIHLSTLRPERLEFERHLSRQRYEKFHRPELLSNYFNQSYSTCVPIPELTSEFKPRLDEWAAWMESQLSFSRLWFRFIYRFYRRLRRLFS
jgi:glycosyltransferase involved in cell wall biosynthesis